jgi:hypothetical protein
MTLEMFYPPQPQPAIDTREVWRNNALVAGGTILATGALSRLATAVTTAVMGNEAFSAEGIGFGAGTCIVLGSSYVQSKLDHTDNFSTTIGIFGGFAASYTLLPYYSYDIAMTVGATCAAVGAGTLAVEIKRRFPNGLFPQNEPRQ